MVEMTGCSPRSYALTRLIAIYTDVILVNAFLDYVLDVELVWNVFFCHANKLNGSIATNLAISHSRSFGAG